MDDQYIDIVYNVDFNEEQAEDVTEFIKDSVPMKNKSSIKKVLKYKKLYKIYFCFGYTAFLKEVRYARSLGETKWLAKIATDERENGFNREHYIEEFKRNKINFDGYNMPIFIDTFEQVKRKLHIH